VLEFRPGTKRGMQILARPGVGLHEGREGLSFGLKNRLQSIQPGPIEVLRPGIQLERGDLLGDLVHLGVIIQVVVFAHFVQEVQRQLGALRSKEVQRFRQVARFGHGTHVAPHHLAKNVLVECEALPHKSEPLGHISFILPDPDPHRVDLGRR